MATREAYGYVVARLRAMEHRFLDPALLQRMVDAEDLAGAYKLLSETVYGPALAGNRTGRFDEALESALLETYREVQGFVPEPAVLEIARLLYDFHNVKVLLKSVFSLRQGGKKRWDLLTSLGSIPLDDLIANVDAEDFRLLPYGLSRVVPQCMACWEQCRDLLEVDRLLDGQYFVALTELVDSLGYEGIRMWARQRIDAENLRVVLRLRRFGFDANRTLPFLHEGGTLRIPLLLSLLTEPLESWPRLLSFSAFSQAAWILQEQPHPDEVIPGMEKALDDHASVYWASFRYQADAPENVLAFLWGKEMEVKNLRIVLVSKASRSDRDKVRRLLRHGYP